MNTNERQKAILLRVGIDKGYGFLSPINPDFTYQYLPIYYKNKIETERLEKRTYRDIKGFDDEPLSNYVPEKFQNKTVHLDPEFESFTYGEMSDPKRGALKKLNPGDLLIFYLGGEVKIGNKSELGCFIFGYFVVEKVYEWSDERKNQTAIKKRCGKNAHIRSSKSKDNLVIVTGTNQSRILERCIYFTRPNQLSKNPAYITKDSFQKKYGIPPFVTRANCYKITNSSCLDSLARLIGI